MTGCVIRGYGRSGAGNLQNGVFCGSGYVCALTYVGSSIAGGARSTPASSGYDGNCGPGKSNALTYVTSGGTGTNSGGTAPPITEVRKTNPFRGGLDLARIG